MADPTRRLVEKQIGRVRLRLFARTLLESLLLCWTFGLLLAVFWFLLSPFLLDDFAVRLGVAAGLLGLGTIAGLALAILRRPDRVTAALALDEAFGLRERVTTYLTLPVDQLATPAGQALGNDVKTHLTTLLFAGKFPLRLSWPRLLMPAGALALAVAAVFVGPLLGGMKFTANTDDEPARPKIDAAKLEEFEKLKKNVAQRNQEQSVKSEDLRKMEEEFEQLLKQPLDLKNEEKVRDRINAFRKLEDKMKERMADVKGKTERIDAFKKQLEKLGLDKDKSLKDGPAKDFEDALRKGDLDQAKAVLEKLAKDLKNGKLDAKQQKELAEQFKKVQDKLQKLMNEDQMMKKLQKDLADKKITKDEMIREMQNFKHLQDLTDILGEAKDALANAAGKEGGEQLDKLLKQFGEIELTEAEMRDLLRDQQEIADALDLLDDPNADDGDGTGGGRPGRRRRADPNDPDSKIRDTRSGAYADPKGKQRVTGYARGGVFSKIPAQAVEGAFKQAAQDGPEALERQMVPEGADEVTRGYFQNLERESERRRPPPAANSGKQK
jgi:hypothetical protein